MMARAKRIYILMIKINEGFNYFSSRCFLKEIENIRESLGELEKAVETLIYRLVFPQHFSFSQTSTHVSITTGGPDVVFDFGDYVMSSADKTMYENTLNIALNRTY